MPPFVPAWQLALEGGEGRINLPAARTHPTIELEQILETRHESSFDS